MKDEIGVMLYLLLVSGQNNCILHDWRKQFLQGPTREKTISNQQRYDSVNRMLILTGEFCNTLINSIAKNHTQVQQNMQKTQDE